MSFINGKKKSSNYSIRLPEETKEDLQKFADRKGVKPSFIVRKAVEEFILRDQKGDTNG